MLITLWRISVIKASVYRERGKEISVFCLDCHQGKVRHEWNQQDGDKM